MLRHQDEAEFMDRVINIIKTNVGEIPDKEKLTEEYYKLFREYNIFCEEYDYDAVMEVLEPLRAYDKEHKILIGFKDKVINLVEDVTILSRKDLCTFNLKETFELLKDNKCTSFIEAHNHPRFTETSPYGRPGPTDRDITTMRKTFLAAELYNTKYLDSFILSKDGTYRASDHFWYFPLLPVTAERAFGMENLVGHTTHT